MRPLGLGVLAAVILSAPAGAAGVSVKRGSAFKQAVATKASVRGYLGREAKRAGYRDISLAGGGRPHGGKVTLGVPMGTPLGRYRLHLCAGDRCRTPGKVTVVDDGIETSIQGLSDAYSARDESGDEAAIARTSEYLCKSVYPAKRFTEKGALGSLTRFLVETAGADAMQAFRRSPDYRTAGSARAAAVKALTVGSPGAALAASLRVQQLQPRAVEPLLNVAGLAVSVGHPNEALALLDAAARRPDDGGSPMGISHHSSALATRAAALHMLGRFGEAKAIASGALVDEPALVEAATTAAAATACTGDAKGAAPLVRKGRRRTGGIPRADASHGRASKLRPLQLPALPVNALAMDDYYEQELQRSRGESTKLIGRRQALQSAVRAYADGLPYAARRHLEGIQALAYGVTSRADVKAHRDEINRQSQLIQQEICTIFGDTCNADAKFDTWMDESRAVCRNQPSGCYEREMLARCEPAARMVHQGILAKVTKIDQEQQALHSLASRLISGYAANVFDPQAHALILLAIEEQESNLHAEGVQAIHSWTDSLSDRAEYCVSQPVEPAVIGPSAPGAAEDPGACPKLLKGLNIVVDFGDFKGKVNCQEVKLSADFLKGWIGFFAEVAYDPRANRMTLAGGGRMSFKSDPLGFAAANAKSGMYVTVSDQGVEDVGWRVGAAVQAKAGPFEFKAWGGEESISFVPVVKAVMESL